MLVSTPSIENRIFSNQDLHEPMEVDLSRKVVCFKCKNQGHKASNCRPVRSASSGACYKCGGKDHIAKSCKNGLAITVGSEMLATHVAIYIKHISEKNEKVGLFVSQAFSSSIVFIFRMLV